MHKNDPNKAGSALLLTLLIVSLMMVIVLSFVVFVRIELRAVQNRIELRRAQANAKVAMHLALDKMQVFAGPDQRVTARADITGVTGSGSFWTGVWENDGSGGVIGTPVWLVSGTNPDPASPGTRVMFPAINSDAAVQVRSETLENTSGDTIGELAFWVSEEGTKASALARRQSIDVFTDINLSPDRVFIEYQSDFGIDLGAIFSNPSIDLQDTAFPYQIEKVSLPDQFLLATDSAGAQFTLNDTDLPLHDVTTLALGVLENPVDGGLKVNLSSMAPTGDPANPPFRDTFLATDETWEFLDPDKPDILEVEYGTPGDAGISPGEPYFSPRPILTEAVLYLGLFHTRSDGKLRTRYHVEAEVLNPYSLPMELDQGTFGALTMTVRNLPEVTIEDLSGVGPTIVQDLDDAVNNNNARSSSYYCSVEISPNPSGSSEPYLFPGQVYQSFAPNQSQGLARNIGSQAWTVGTGQRPGDNAQIEITADHGTDPLLFQLVDTNYDGLNQGAPIVQSIQIDRATIPYTDFNFQKTFFSGPNPFSRSTSGSYNINDYNLAYHYRLWSEETDSQSLRDLLTRIPFLDPDFNLAGTFTDIDGNDVSYDTIMSPVDLDPSVVVMSINPFDGQDVFMDNNRNTHGGSNREMVLVDIPTDDVLSVGALSSLPIYRLPIRTIGSPWGGTYNQAFDRYYFSPKKSHPTTAQPLLRNPALLHWKDEQTGGSNLRNSPDDDDAEHELVSGQFNINSTSIPAWEAVLGAPILAGTSTVNGAYFRQPQRVAETGEYTTSLNASRDVDNAFSSPGRLLNQVIFRTFVNGLANDIVDRIKLQATPFPTMESFVNSGILQEAIDSVLTDRGGGPISINDRVMQFSNLYITQNDLLARIAPTTSTRSDTFTIRAFGNVTAPGDPGKVISEAMCEAVVQRVPTKLDGSNAVTPTTSLLDSREFRIISFRWLTNEDS